MVLLEGVSNSFLLVIGSIVVLGAFLILVISGLIKRIESGEQEIFEHQDIENMIKPEIRKLLDYWGSGTSIKLRYRYDLKGKVYKQLDYTAAIDDSEDGDKKNKKKNAIEIKEEQLEQDYKDDKISERTYKMIKEFEEESVHILLVGPTGIIGKLSWVLAEKIFNFNNVVSRLIIVPERLIRDDVDYMTIVNNAEFTRFAGMDVAVEASAFNFIESIGFKNLYSQALQDQQNYHKQVNFFSSRFSQELQKLEKESDLEGQKFAGRTVKIVNED